MIFENKTEKNDESLFDDEKLYPTTAIRRRMNVMELCGWRIGVGENVEDRCRLFLLLSRCFRQFVS